MASLLFVAGQGSRTRSATVLWRRACLPQQSHPQRFPEARATRLSIDSRGTGHSANNNFHLTEGPKMIDCLASFGRNRRSLSAIVAVAVGAALVASAAGKATAAEMSPAAKAVVDYDKSGAKPTKKYRIAYLTECVDNPYCLARLAGLKAAAAKFGFEYKIFDANFSPATQAKVVENAVTEGFDGSLFGPAAAQPGCGLYNRLLKPTGKPVVSIDIAMCGDPDYTPGLSATLTMQGPAHFNEA